MAARSRKAEAAEAKTEETAPKAVVSTPGKITPPEPKKPTVVKTGNGTVVRSF